MTVDLGFIHRFLPAEDSSHSETLVVLHGTGGDENDLIGIGQAIAPGAAIVSPRGNVLEAGAPRFFKRLAEGVFDPKEVRSRAEELARFIRVAVSKYGLNPERIFALGYSNGANVASTVCSTWVLISLTRCPTARLVSFGEAFSHSSLS